LDNQEQYVLKALTFETSTTCISGVGMIRTWCRFILWWLLDNGCLG